MAIKVRRRAPLTRRARLGDAEAYMAEARIAARWEHPYIVPVLDVGRTDDGLRFVVSRFIAEAHAPLIVGVARRLLGTLASLGI